jgi:hypothetical protein
MGEGTGAKSEYGGQGPTRVWGTGSMSGMRDRGLVMEGETGAKSGYGREGDTRRMKDRTGATLTLVNGGRGRRDGWHIKAARTEPHQGGEENRGLIREGDNRGLIREGRRTGALTGREGEQ